MILPVVAAASGIAAGDSIYFALSDGRTLGVATEKVDSVSFSGNASQMLVSVGGNENAVPVAETDSLYFGAVTDKIEISYGSDGVKVLNPKAFEEVNIAVDGDDVVVTSTTSEELEYVLSGASTDGMFKIYSDKKFKLTLNGLTLTNNDGPAINIQSGKKTTLTLADGTVNTLADGAKYTACGDEDMKATLFSEGQIVVQGNGTLNVSGKKKHGICSDDYILVSSGVVNVTDAASDGIHANDYVRIDGGSVSITASGDGIDGDTGYVQITGGDVTVNVSTDAAKGIKCDGAISISGGNVNISTSGNVLIQDGDTSYCTAVKSDSDFSITDGSLTIMSSGSAGKGISVDGNVSIAGGTVSIATTGDGGTYTTADGTTDSYSATGIKADGNIEILAGSVTVTSAGTGGKGISADGTLTIGGDVNVPTVIVTTTGKKFYVSGYGEDAAGNAVLTYQVPSKYSGNVMLLFSDAVLAQGTTYTIYTGGAITGAEEFHGYYTGGTYSGGTKASTFTPTSMITTIGSGGGNRPGGGGGGGGRP